jgi:hypothetical protein
MRRLTAFGAGLRGPLFLLAGAAALARLPLLLTPGYDVRDYKVWARVVAEIGPGRMYGAAMPPDIPWYNYPPLYLFVLDATGPLYRLVHPDGDWTGQDLAAMLKLSPLLAEIATGVLLAGFLRHRVAAQTAHVWTAAFLFNPALIWNTAYWGGIDALHAFFLAAALFAATTRPYRAWPLAVLAVCAKPLALPGALATVPPVLRTGCPRRLAKSSAAAVAVGLLVSAPVLVRGEGPAMAEAMARNLGNQAVVSANAHNLWWLAMRGEGWQSDTRELAPGLDYRATGLLLFAAIAVWALARLWRRAGSAVAVCATGGFLTYAFCMLTTEAHENWGVALFTPLAAAAALCPCYRALYAALCLVILANLGLHDPPLRAWLGHELDGALRWLGVVNAAVGCGLLGWWAVLLARAVRDAGSPPSTGHGSGAATASAPLTVTVP